MMQVRKQGGGFHSTAYIDGIFEHTRESSYAIETIPDLRIGDWVIAGKQTGEQCTLHIMDGQSRIATRRTGDALNDTTPAIKYNVEDHLNSSCILLDINGSLINKEENTPFGETAFGSYGKKKYRYNGKEKDEESGLYNYGMRYYSPWTCRFMSVDPLAPKYPFYTPYQYAGNKPINKKDIDGMEEEGKPSQGGGGGDGKASDGTGASDHKGRDIVNGVETWKDEKTGEIRVEIDRNTSQEVDKSPKSLKTKEAIKDHWKKDGGETNNIEPKDSTQTTPGPKEGGQSLDKGAKEGIAKNDSTNIIKNQDGSPTPTISGKNEQVKKTEDRIESTNDFLNRAGDVVDLNRDAMKKTRNDSQKELDSKKQVASDKLNKNGKVPERLNQTIKNIEKAVEKLKKWVDNLGVAGVLIDVSTVVLSITKAYKNPTGENIFDAIFDSIGAILSNVVKFGAWLISLAFDAFKESDLYKSVREEVIQAVKKYKNAF